MKYLYKEQTLTTAMSKVILKYPYKKVFLDAVGFMQQEKFNSNKVTEQQAEAAAAAGRGSAAAHPCQDINLYQTDQETGFTEMHLHLADVHGAGPVPARRAVLGRPFGMHNMDGLSSPSAMASAARFWVRSWPACHSEDLQQKQTPI